MIHCSTIRLALRQALDHSTTSTPYIGIKEEWGKWAPTLDFVEKFRELGSEENYFYMIHRTECEKLDMQSNTSDNSKYADISLSLNVHLSVCLVSASY